MHCVGLLFEEIRENLHMSILVLVDDSRYYKAFLNVEIDQSDRDV